MRFKQKLPVTYLLFTFNGRLSKSAFWTASLFYWCTFYVLYNILLFGIGEWATFILYPLLFWIIAATSVKRLHDQDYSGYWLFAVLVPVIGPLWLIWRLGLKKGSYMPNPYGPVPGSAPDYLKNDNGRKIPHLKTDERIIDDVTKLNPVLVAKIVRPTSIAEVSDIIKSTNGSISVGGGRFSMGGQTASPHTTHVDMRSMNKILEFSAGDKLIKVQTGIRWCDIQQFIDEYGLSISIMQTYANFTVGGALSVNAHGRYMGMGPLVLSVRSIDVVLADGAMVQASPTENQEIFFGAIGGYNGIGVIVNVQLQLADNLVIKRVDKKMKVEEYKRHFMTTIRDDSRVIFHNGDIYPPRYKRLRSVSWIETTEKPTVKTRLTPLRESYPLERYFLWAFTETPLGKWRREFLIDPLLFRGKKIHWRNYEAGYDVAELEPRSRTDSTYVLLEYFVPINRFEEFEQAMAEIFIRFNVNVLNVSIRHAKADPGTYLAWAREEVFAFVVYYKQRTDADAKHKVAVWTRELADAVNKVNGSYYLPYQVHPTEMQFHTAYPNAQKLFDLKKRLDPNCKFKNIFWDTYYKPLNDKMMDNNQISKFKAVFNDTKWSDDFYRFLQVIFHLYPEDKFHRLIKDETSTGKTDEEIYKSVQDKLKTIKPFLSELTYALPALKKQKREIAAQTLQLSNDLKSVNGYAEIGSTGRYINELKRNIKVAGPIFLINDRAPGNSPGDIMERGQLSKLGVFVDIDDYNPINNSVIPDACLDVVTCYIGLHHCPVIKLNGFIKSIHRILRPGGLFIIRDHDVKTADMGTFVSLIHTVFNIGLNETWEFEDKDFKNFKPADDWARMIETGGFTDAGKRILQKNDPSDNTLMLFVKNNL